MAGRPNQHPTRSTGSRATRPVYPFTAIVGQEEMKLALLLNVISPAVGGVLVMGHRGTGKSTAVRALAELLPPLTSVRDCTYNCDPRDVDAACADCRRRLAAGERLKREQRPVPVVELPLGATEDRVCGTIDIERALKEGVKAFEPGLLARANRGFLYIDEVNLLEDHLVDVLLDAAATGTGRVEREGVSAEHPARFVLVGSGNPEEGELRPQFLDRFGTSVEVQTILDPAARVSIVEQREAFERDPEGFIDARQAELEDLRRRLVRAARAERRVETPREILFSIAELCVRLGVDGHRGELTITRAARALAAFEGRKKITAADVRRVAPMCLRHRLRRDPLEMVEGGARIEQAVEDIYGEDPEGPDEGHARRGNGPDYPPPHSFDHTGAAPTQNTPLEKNRGHERGFRQADTGSNHHDPHRPSDREALDAAPSTEERVIPSATAALPESALDSHRANTARGSKGRSHARRSAGPKRTSPAPRGRYATATADKTHGARVAVDATLRRASVAQSARHASATHAALPD
ncbi:MAG TPA: magnesium chelatase ATPase subunit I, partial [Pyrinomonadaceae bacterium]